MIYIIAYDIADNKRRLRVAKTLESWGYRIQESVFQLRLDSATLARVRSTLAVLISESDDVIHIYPIGLVWFCGPGVVRVVGCY